MTDHAARVLAAMRSGGTTMRIVDLRHATGLVTTEVRDALAELCSQRIVYTTAWGMRYALRDRTSICPPAAPAARTTQLADDTQDSNSGSRGSVLGAVGHIGEGA